MTFKVSEERVCMTPRDQTYKVSYFVKCREENQKKEKGKRKRKGEQSFPFLHSSTSPFSSSPCPSPFYSPSLLPWRKSLSNVKKKLDLLRGRYLKTFVHIYISIFIVYKNPLKMWKGEQAFLFFSSFPSLLFPSSFLILHFPFFSPFLFPFQFHFHYHLRYNISISKNEMMDAYARVDLN